MVVRIDTDRVERGLPAMAQLGNKLVVVDGVNRNKFFDGEEMMPLSIEQPRILEHGQKLGDDYVSGTTVVLNAFSTYATNRLKGSMLTVTDGTHTEESLITANTSNSVTIETGFSNGYAKADTTYKIHRKYSLAATTSGGKLTDSKTYLVLVKPYDKSRKRYGTRSEIPEDDTYGDVTFYEVTTGASGSNVNKITIDDLFMPADDEVSHWVVFMTTGGGERFHKVREVEIGTWNATKTIVLNALNVPGDSWIDDQPELDMENEAFPTSPVVVAGDNRIFIGGSEVISEPGTVSLTAGSRNLTGTDTEFRKAMEGMQIQPEGSRLAYKIRTVISPLKMILHEKTLETWTGVTYKIFSWPKTIWPSEIDSYFGEPHIEGTNVYAKAIELPISRGGKLVGMAPLPGHDMLALSEEEGIRIHGKRKYTAEQVFMKGAESKISIAWDESLVTWLHQYGMYGAQYGTLARLLTQRIPRHLSDEEVNREHHWSAPGGIFSSEGGTTYGICFLAAAGEDDHGLALCRNMTSGNFTTFRGIAATAFGLLTDQNGLRRPVVGDAFGMVSWLWQAQSATNNSMGARTVYRRGVATDGNESNSTTQLIDESTFRLANPFETGDSGERGRPIWLINGTGAGQMRYVYSNTATKILPHKPWNPAPDETTIYHLGLMRSRGKKTWTDLYSAGSTKKEVLWLDCTFAKQDPLYGGNDDRIYFTQDGTTIEAIGDLTFSENVVGQPVFMEDDFDHIAWVKSQDASNPNTKLNLVGAWEGDSMGSRFTIGAKFLEIRCYKDADEETVWKTIYVPAHKAFVSANLGIRVGYLQIDFYNWDEPPFELWRIDTRFAALPGA